MKLKNFVWDYVWCVETLAHKHLPFSRRKHRLVPIHHPLMGPPCWGAKKRREVADDSLSFNFLFRLLFCRIKSVGEPLCNILPWLAVRARKFSPLSKTFLESWIRVLTLCPLAWMLECRNEKKKDEEIKFEKNEETRWERFLFQLTLCFTFSLALSLSRSNFGSGVRERMYVKLFSAVSDSSVRESVRPRALSVRSMRCDTAVLFPRFQSHVASKFHP